MGKRAFQMRILIAAFTFFAFAGTVLSILSFHSNMEKEEYERQRESLLDMAKLEASVIEVKLEDYINTLHAIAEFLYQGDLYTSGHMENLHSLVGKGHFQGLGIITPDGMLHSTLGETDVSDRDYYKGILRGENFVTGILVSKFTGKNIIVMAVPVYDENGDLCGAAHGTVLLDSFEPYTGTSLAVGNTDTYVFDRSGEYIIKSNEEGASRDYDNIFDHLEQAAGGISMEELRIAVGAGKPVTTEVISGGETYLCRFLPIRNGEWYALVTVRSDQVRDRVSAMLDADFYRMLAIIVLLVGMLCLVILIWNHRRGVWERTRERELRERLMAQVVGFMVVDMDEDRILSLSGRGLLRRGMENRSYPVYIADILALGAYPEHQRMLEKFFSSERICADVESGFRERNLEFRFRYMPEGDYVWLECESRLDRDQTTGHLIASHILRDIDSRKREELALRSEAERDMLTGLYNRSTAVKMIGRSLEDGPKTELHALILLDLDNFKTLNDTLGHQCGDQALRDVAGIIAGHFRRDDVVCRLGGDEFIVFLKGISAGLLREKLGALLEKLHLAYGEPQSVWIDASAGVAYATAGESFESLYSRADQALYQAKREGKATFRENRPS